jgi:predicted nucleic acid-binding protein
MARPTGVVYDHIALIDTSAVIALYDPAEQRHVDAKVFWEGDNGLVWATVNATSHELYTRVRYREAVPAALEHYQFLRGGSIQVLAFTEDDEKHAEEILAKYAEHSISFHDALCAAVMLRAGIYKIFTFDRDFWILGFEVLPGIT